MDNDLLTAEFRRLRQIAPLKWKRKAYKKESAQKPSASHFTSTCNIRHCQKIRSRDKFGNRLLCKCSDQKRFPAIFTTNYVSETDSSYSL